MDPVDRLWASALSEIWDSGQVAYPGASILASKGLDSAHLDGKILQTAMLQEHTSQRPMILRNFLIDGDLILTHLRLPQSLLIENCEMAGALVLDGSRFGELILNGSRLSRLSARGANFAGSVVAEHLAAIQIDLQSASVDGDIQISFASLNGIDAGPSVLLDGAKIKGSIEAKSLEVSAGLSIRDARVGGSLHLDESILHGSSSRSLDTTGSDILGDLILEGATLDGAFVGHRMHTSGRMTADGVRAGLIAMDGARTEGGLSLRGARIRTGVQAIGSELGRQFDAQFSALGDTAGVSINLDQAGVAGPVLLSDSVITGAISLARTSVTGPVVAERAEVTSDSGVALCLDGATVGGIALSQCDIVGQITGAEMGCRTSAEFSGSKVRTPGAGAIQLERSTIGGDLVLSGTAADGKISLTGTTIGGSLIGAECVISHHGGPCLELDAVKVARDVSLSSCRCATSVSASSISCGGRLDICSSSIDGEGPWSLFLYGARVEQGLDLRNLVASSPVDVQRSIITGGVALGGTQITSRGSAGMVLAQSRIDTLDLRLQSPALSLDLRGCTIGTLFLGNSLAEWYPLWDATGFSVEDFRGVGTDSLKPYVRWLNDAKGVALSTQPWHEIADWFERVGNPSSAKRLRFAAAARLTSAMPAWTRPVRWLYLISAGYGYYPLFALLWFALLWMGTLLMVQGSLAAFHPTGALPAAATAGVVSAATPCLNLGGYPCFDPIAYTNGVVSPVGWLHPYPWSPTDAAFSYVMWASSAARTTGWALSAVLLAGISGLLKKG